MPHYSASPNSCPEIRAIRDVTPRQSMVPVVKPRKTTEAVVFHFPKHKTAWEKDKETEVARLTGRLQMPRIDQHRVSRQSSFNMESFCVPEISNHDWRGHKENRANARDRHLRSALKASGDRPRC